MAKNKQKNRQNTPSTTPNSPITKASALSSDYTVSDFKMSPTVAYIILGLAVLIAFAGGFSNGFVNWDDNAYVTDNVLIQTPTFANLLRLLRVEAALNYHPITMASLWLNSALFGKGAGSFIVVNTLIHLVNTFLIFRFTSQLTKNNVLISFLVALLWGIHPMHVESVTWVSERKDVLYTMFFFLACIQYVKYLEQNQRKYYVYCLIFFLLSCLSKAMAVVLPLVLLLLDYWFDRGFLTVKNILSKAPFWIIALAFGALAVQIQSGKNLNGLIEKMTLDVAIADVFDLGTRIKFGFYGFLVYLFKLFIPINQHNFYAYPETGQYGALEYVTAPIWAFIILGLAIAAYKRKKVVFFGVMFFFFTIVLVLQFLSVGGAILAERYSYIPYFGIIFAVFYLLNQRIQSKKMLLAGSGIVAVIFMYLTYKQTLTYKDTGTLFLNSYKYEPNSPVVNENLANHFGRLGEIDKVLNYGEFALSKGVQSYALMGALANAYYLKGNIPKALDFYQKSIDGSPDHRKFIAYYNRGIANRDGGNYIQAAKDFSAAMTLRKDSTAYIGMRAFAYLKANKFQEAYNDYSRMINFGIAVDTAYNDRAVARFSMGDREGAIKDLREVMKRNPNYVDARNNLIKLGEQP
ncbi:tetratricopeptide repeat protein [Emticicia sp. 17c]|uniref:tetratricopeptide repeat protein n=1 Tax=Emticicia sp. 17c TaxID=3127704 RepID=UPI00301C29DE